MLTLVSLCVLPYTHVKQVIKETWVWWHVPEISLLRRIRRSRQDHLQLLSEFNVSLGYRSACLKNKMNEGYLGES